MMNAILTMLHRIAPCCCVTRTYEYFWHHRISGTNMATQCIRNQFRCLAETTGNGPDLL